MNVSGKIFFLRVLAFLFSINLHTQNIISFHPNQWNKIGRFEKLEIGISLPIGIENQIESFLIGKEGINPYDFHLIIIRATFKHNNSTFTREGFYLREIAIDTIKNIFSPFKSQYPFRIRFAPPEEGNYSVNIECVLNGSVFAYFNQMFNVVESSKRGFLNVGNFYRLKDSRENNFFAIGQNIAFCADPWVLIRPLDYIRHRSYIKDLKANAGNFFRLRMNAWDFEMELEELKVYGSNRTTNENYARQWQAYELDKVFQLAEQLDLYMFLTILGDSEFHTDNKFNFEWKHNPYRKTAENMIDFFDIDKSSIEIFKNKLQYIMARYGYSPNIGVLSLINETDQIEQYKIKQEVRSLINGWLAKTGSYLKNNFYPKHLLTTGYSASPDAPDLGADYFNFFDIISSNRYDASRRAVKNQLDAPEKMITEKNSKKPFIFGEMGTGLCEEALPDWYSDAGFHNTIWSTSMYSRAMGTGLFWWDWEQESHLEPKNNAIKGINHRANFNALNTFFTVNPPPFEIDEYDSDWDSDAETLQRVEKRKIEWISNVNQNGSRGFGWVHNSDYYWINDPLKLTSQNTPNIISGGMDVFNNSDCSKEEQSAVEFFNEPQGPYEYRSKSEIIVLKGFQPNRKYTIEIWSCYGKGGLIETFSKNSNTIGRIHFSRTVGRYAGDSEYGNPDFSYKIYLAEESFVPAAEFYPNPTAGEMSIASQKAIFRILTFNLTGQMVKSFSNFQSNNFSINLFDLQAGIYIAIVEFQDGKTYRTKIIKY